MVLQIYDDISGAPFGYCLLISRHYKKIRCLLCTKYHAGHRVCVLFYPYKHSETDAIVIPILSETSTKQIQHRAQVTELK